MPEINAMIAVQSRGGMQFGYVRSADEQRIVFEVEAPIHEAEEIEWRMQLIGYPETAMGRCVIDRISNPPNRWPIFHARITHMSDADRAMYDGWLRDFAEGGTSRRLERKGGEIEQGLLTGLRTQTTGMHKMALERIAQRDALRKAIRRKGNAPVDAGDAFGLGTESAASGAWSPETGREAVRAALREAARGLAPAPPRAARPAPVAEPLPAPEPPVQAPPAVQALSEEDDFLREPEPEPPAPDPAVEISSGGAVPRVTVRWREPAAFREAWTRHLKASALLVPAPGLDRPRLSVEIVLVVPSGAEISCPAQVASVAAGGVGFALLLSPGQSKALAAEAARG